LCYILGLKLADPVSGSAWQPSQPIFTATLAIIIGYERSSIRKAIGILTAVGGAIFMVLEPMYLNSEATTEAGSAVDFSERAGHALFFLNCIASSFSYIFSKSLLKRYHPGSVTGWAYAVASVFMLVTTLFVNQTEPLLSFVCSDEDELMRRICIKDAWRIPRSMRLPLFYYVFLGSLLGYFIIAWANQYAKASVVSSYTVVQTLTASGMSALLVAVGGVAWAEKYGLRAPGTQDFGVVPIIMGLIILFGDPGGTMQPSTAAGIAGEKDGGKGGELSPSGKEVEVQLQELSFRPGARGAERRATERSAPESEPADLIEAGKIV
jgi:drug/metabolite transporter (DMT)-like permease